MCGIIAGFTNSTDLAPAVQRGMDRMRRRGPDGEGFWQENGVYLGHRRLAIIDLDGRAAQPMSSACGRYTIVFNGEIYNYRELRDALVLEGAAFRTTSDTEVILALFAADGAAMLSRLRGMFALVIWDRTARRAFAARDPYGIKPLYYARTAHGVMVASQVKALLATGCVSLAPDPVGQAGFWLLGSVPEPRTWFRDISTLPSGHYAWIENGRAETPVCWSDIGSAWRDAPTAPVPDAVAQRCVRGALRESVARHLVADVPVGVFLSGGIDSGALAGLMVGLGARSVEGVTLAYEEFAGGLEDEAPAAAAIAARYGIDHHVRLVSREEFLADLPRILDAMDQPTIDGINTWYACKAAAERGLKVVLSGVGGDELFQGYSSFRTLPRIVGWWRPLSRLPGAMALGRAAGNLQARRSGNGRWRHAPAWARSISGAWWLGRSLYPPESLPRLMGAAAARSAADLDATAWIDAMTGPTPTDHRLALSQIESTTYLRNQLLRDSDWACMDHSVELRTPLVDAHLLASLQPVLASLSRYRQKRLLAEAPDPPLPRHVVTRRKTGFGIPIDRWLSPAAGTTSRVDSRAWARQVADAYTAGSGTIGPPTVE